MGIPTYLCCRMGLSRSTSRATVGDTVPGLPLHVDSRRKSPAVSFSSPTAPSPLYLNITATRLITFTKPRSRRTPHQPHPTNGFSSPASPPLSSSCVLSLSLLAFFGWKAASIDVLLG